MATAWERMQAARLGLHATALAALSQPPPGPLALHLDVDVLDFTDAPLAENTDGRNARSTLDQVAEALSAAARDQRMRAPSIGELNRPAAPGHLFPCNWQG
jgi:arginase